MQFEDALGKVTDPEVKAYFQKMYSEQNSYITKLEQQLKAAKEQPSQQGTPSGAGVDDITAKYLEKNMRRDVIAEAENIIKQSVSEEVFNAIKPDWNAFLEKVMTKAKTTVDFAVDAFKLTYGECIMKADHPVNKIGKTTPTPGGTPTPPVNPGTNADNVKGVNDILSKQPPVMTGADGGAQPGIPTPGAVQYKNTKDSFAALRNRFNQAGGNKFQQ